MITTPFPIASVVYEGDLRLGILQVLSVDRLVPSDVVSRYTIILNGADNGKIRDYFEKTLRKALTPSLNDKLELIEWADVLKDAERDGYYDQQALKLGLSRRYREPYYLLLDAKNHLTRPLQQNDIFRDGLPISPFKQTTGVWPPYVERSFLAVNKPDADTSMMLPSTTPYMIYTEPARELVSFLTSKYQASLPKALRASGGTEFLLYYAWIAEIRDDLYSNYPQPVRTLFTSWPQETSVINSFLDEVAAGKAPFLGIHRNRLNQLSVAQKHKIVAIWKNTLLHPWEDGDWFLSPDQVPWTTSTSN